MMNLLKRRSDVAMASLLKFGVLVMVPVLLAGCASPPPTTGFLADYSKLKKVEGGKLRFISPHMPDYKRFIIDPIQIRVDRGVLNATDRAEVARYAWDAFVKIVRNGGYEVTNTPGVGVARVRIAITDVQLSKWYLNLHPASKMTGAGAGGASMEAEVIDSVTGMQLAAVVQAGKGSQFELDTFSKLDDVKDVIDRWAQAASERLKEMRESRGGS